MAAAVSPLAPISIPVLPEIAGVRFAAGAAGIRYEDRPDVILALFDKGTQVAGVFTKSKCPSAAVDWCRARLKAGKARALVVNSGNANAFTGKAGVQSVKLTPRLPQVRRARRQWRFFSPRPASSASHSMLRSRRRAGNACRAGSA